MSNASLDAATAKDASNQNIQYGRGVMLTAIGIIQGKICFVRIMTHEFQNTGHVNTGESMEAADSISCFGYSSVWTKNRPCNYRAQWQLCPHNIPLCRAPQMSAFNCRFN